MLNCELLTCSFLDFMEKSAQHRILVVDDNQDAAELLQMLLEFQEYEVRIAFDGATALAIATDFHPHVTCSDLNMPGMSGFALASELRKSNHSCKAYLVAMTGLSTDENYQEAMRSGFDVCLTKPFNIEEFVSHLGLFFAKIKTH
jgi:DNA-binding response OmpR family regulator